MKIFKKCLNIITIASTVILALLLILLLFNITVSVSDDKPLALYFTFGSIAVGGFFAINSVNAISKNKIVGWISFALIALSVLLICIISWTDQSTLLNVSPSLSIFSILFNLTLSLSILSIIFNIIVSFVLELGKKYLPAQIVLYTVAGILYIFVTLSIFNALPNGNGTGTKIFIICFIIEIVALLIFKIYIKKQTEQNMIRISSKEYEILKEKAKKYDEFENQSASEIQTQIK